MKRILRAIGWVPAVFIFTLTIIYATFLVACDIVFDWMMS